MIGDNGGPSRKSTHRVGFDDSAADLMTGYVWQLERVTVGHLPSRGLDVAVADTAGKDLEECETRSKTGLFGIDDLERLTVHGDGHGPHVRMPRATVGLGRCIAPSPNAFVALTGFYQILCIICRTGGPSK